jgi:hypothetical protein
MVLDITVVSERGVERGAVNESTGLEISNLTPHLKVKGATPDNPLQETHPDVPRLKVKNLAVSKEAARRFLQKKGFQVSDLEGFNFALKKPDEDVWRVLDPEGFDLKDILDIGGDVAEIAGATVGAGLGAAGGLGGAAAGGALGAGAVGGLRASLGASLGLGTPEEALGRTAQSAAAGALAPVGGKALQAVSPLGLAAKGVAKGAEAVGSRLGGLGIKGGEGALTTISKGRQLVVGRQILSSPTLVRARAALGLAKKAKFRVPGKSPLTPNQMSSKLEKVAAAKGTDESTKRLARSALEKFQAGQRTAFSAALFVLMQRPSARKIFESES